MAKLFNRAWMTVSGTPGTGTITLNAAQSAAYLTFAESGVADTNVVAYVLEDGDNFEISIGTYTAAGTTLSRDTVTKSKEGGTAGTAKITASSAATVFLLPRKEDLLSITETQTASTVLAGPTSGGAAAPAFRALVAADLIGVSHCRPFFAAQSTAGTTLAANTFTKIEFNSELFDSDAYYDPTTNYRFTPLVAGKYVVLLTIALAGGPAVDALFAADIYKNGTRFQQGLKRVVTTDNAASLQIQCIVDMNGSTDYLEAFGYNGQAANSRTIDVSSFSNFFGAFRIGA